MQNLIRYDLATQKGVQPTRDLLNLSINDYVDSLYK